jgi:hypothetical protein
LPTTANVDARNFKDLAHWLIVQIGPISLNVTTPAGQFRESFTGGNTIISADTNGDGKADFSIELQGHHSMHAADFVL